MKLIALLFSLSIFVVHTSYANTANVQVSKGHIEVIDNIESQFVKKPFFKYLATARLQQKHQLRRALHARWPHAI
ncbi:hypothetical protein [Pseudoalteromonas sp. 10-33]|uniref:hypothetical protein n=1 Tax=Pseudoalteromonas sp. 10-33 TaxID=1761890 RepID=UPI001F402E96|nr:hypothetical protein [Pseudoalteromonas sp. 10-33]